MSASEEHRRARTWRAGAMALASGLSPKKGRGGRKWRAGTCDQGPATKVPEEEGNFYVPPTEDEMRMQYEQQMV